MIQFVAKIRENAMCMQGSTNASTKKGHRNVEHASQVFVHLIRRVFKDFIAVSECGLLLAL